MLGYPGAGKTTIAREIARQTGAIHLWADHERRAMFAKPTHSRAESNRLYSNLNDRTRYLLSHGQSVVFDTSFNHYADREHLRRLATESHAKTVLVWVNTPLEVARSRAVNTAHAERNHYEEAMSETAFNRIVSHLEPPKPQEGAVLVNDTDLDESRLSQTVASLLTQAAA